MLKHNSKLYRHCFIISDYRSEKMLCSQHKEHHSLGEELKSNPSSNVLLFTWVNKTFLSDNRKCVKYLNFKQRNETFNTKFYLFATVK